MGRISANTTHQFQVQPKNDQHQMQTHQEYTSHEEVESFDHQQAETIEEIAPPSTELFHEDLYPEESQNEPSLFASQELIMQSKSQENQDSVQQHQQSVLLALPPSPQQPTSRPVTTQRPRKQRQPQSGVLQSQQPSQHNSFPPVHDPQPQAEPFPPPQSQDYYEPHVFPPTQEEAQAFPPTPVHAFPQPHAQSVPQAFPPVQDSYEPHGFPPTQLEKEDFPPTPIKAHAFPPPQFDPKFFPPQAEPQSFVPQNHNVQASTNFSQPNQQFLNAANGLVQAPKGMPPAESWKTGLFDCMQDPTNALITACFPCLTFGQIVEIVDSGHTTCTTSGLIYGAIFFVLMPCIMSCTYRTKLRSQYGLIESAAPDWVIHCFCECCALCQEYRELHLRGLDPSIGWQGNQALKQNMQLQQATMVPPNHQTMMG